MAHEEGFDYGLARRWLVALFEQAVARQYLGHPGCPVSWHIHHRVLECAGCTAGACLHQGGVERHGQEPVGIGAMSRKRDRARSGRPVSVLLYVDDEDEIDRLILAYSPKFRAVFETAEQKIHAGPGDSARGVLACGGRGPQFVRSPVHPRRPQS